MSQAIRPLDNTIDIPTPENIAFHYSVAGPFRRAPAFLLDCFIRWGLITALGILAGLMFMVLFFFLPFLAELIERLAFLVQAGLVVLAFVLDWLYGVVFETYMNGQTPAKRLLKLRVVSSDGLPINGMQAAMRNLLRYADVMPFVPLVVLVKMLERLTGEPMEADAFVGVFFFPTFLLGLIAMACTPRRQRLGDLVANTMVVTEAQGWRVDLVKLDDPRAPELATFIPPKFEFSRSLAKAIAAYVERRKHFAEARRHEMAAHLARPLLKQFGLPPDTDYDLLMCAMYYRAFIADRSEEIVAPRNPYGVGGSSSSPQTDIRWLPPQTSVRR